MDTGEIKPIYSVKNSPQERTEAVNALDRLMCKLQSVSLCCRLGKNEGIMDNSAEDMLADYCCRKKRTICIVHFPAVRSKIGEQDCMYITLLQR